MRYFLIYFLLFFVACGLSKKEEKASNVNPVKKESQPQEIKQDLIRLASGFDFPVGKPDAKRYYNAQPFGENNHLGDDWNATTGGNTDLGHPIYSIGVGKVAFAEDLAGGWGNVVRVLYYVKNDKTYGAVYAHCDSIQVKVGEWVDKGQQIATIGNANGVYLAHLHLEIRDSVGMPIGGGYSEDQTGYIDPTAFIKANRKSE